MTSRADPPGGRSGAERPIEYHVDGEPASPRTRSRSGSGRGRCWSGADRKGPWSSAGSGEQTNERVDWTRPRRGPIPQVAGTPERSAAGGAALSGDRRDGGALPRPSRVANEHRRCADRGRRSARCLRRRGPRARATSWQLALADPARRRARLPTTAGPRCTWPRSSASSRPPRACSKPAPASPRCRATRSRTRRCMPPWPAVTSRLSLFLIARGADVNAADAGSHTPLHIAAEAGYLPVVEALLARGRRSARRRRRGQDAAVARRRAQPHGGGRRDRI